MGLAYDSGWVTGSSGSILASVDCSVFTQLKVIYAASGTNGAASVALGWVEGAGTPTPWGKRTPAYPMTPAITGNFTVAAPAANTASIYYLGAGLTGSGAAHISDWIPQGLVLTATQGAANSWARIIVIGKM